MERFCIGLIAFLCSCYSPNLSGVTYTCDDLNPYCPDGLTCIGGVCRLPGVDAGGNTLMPDALMSAAGCHSGMGFVVGTAFACPGTFDGQKTLASQLCAAGYHICTNATGIDQTTCRTLSGFFAAQVQMHRDAKSLDPMTFACGPAMMMQLRLISGCGRMTANDVFDVTKQACSGFDQALDCILDNAWNCDTAMMLDMAQQSNPGDGVLCCPM